MRASKTLFVMAAMATKVAASEPPAKTAGYSCYCGWILEYACPGGLRGTKGFASLPTTVDECFDFCCPPSPPSPAAPPSPPSPPSPPASPPKPACGHCDAGTECGYCLVLVPWCPYWPKRTKPKCGPDMPVDEWCESDSANPCGTDDPANSCFAWEEIYTRVDCILNPPSPPPPRPPWPPAFPGESAYLPAPPPPSNSDVPQGQETNRDTGVFGPLTLPWLIVIIVLVVCFPLLAIVLCWYLFPGRCSCKRSGKEMSPAPEMRSDLGNLGYAGTLIVDDHAFTGIAP